MDQTVNYADILTQVIHREAELQPSFQPKLKIVAACDRETGQFLLIVVGWDQDRWVHNILFHARLVNGQVIIETDMTEEGLKPALIEAGIRAEDILTGKEADEIESSPVAA